MLNFFHKTMTYAGLYHHFMQSNSGPLIPKSKKIGVGSGILWMLSIWGYSGNHYFEVLKPCCSIQ